MAPERTNTGTLRSFSTDPNPPEQRKILERLQAQPQEDQSRHGTPVLRSKMSFGFVFDSDLVDLMANANLPESYLQQ